MTAALRDTARTKPNSWPTFALFQAVPLAGAPSAGKSAAPSAGISPTSGAGALPACAHFTLSAMEPLAASPALPLPSRREAAAPTAACAR